MSGFTLFRVASLYLVPALGALTILVVFCVLMLRVQRRQIEVGAGAARFALTLVVPPAAVALLWAVTELGSWVLLGAGYAFDARASLDTLLALAPIGLYLAGTVLLLLLAFPVAARVLQRK